MNVSFCVSMLKTCNTKDPDLDNPMHRIHKEKSQCQRKAKSFKCPHCGQRVKNNETLNGHIKSVNYLTTRWKLRNFNYLKC